MRFETTVHRPVEAEGVGLHHGVAVKIRILPAPPMTGIVFIRTDLDRFAIPASWRYVARVSYATSLMRQGVLISTTEHLLSVFYSMGIDNAYVEIDNLEVPILDGSGAPFVKLIEQVGVRTYRRRRRYLRIRRPVEVEARGKRIAILPAETFRLSCDVFFDHPLVGRQRLDLEVTPENYAREIAPARTFGFAWELDAMRDMGLIRGASLENAVCFDRTGVLNDSGLRFADECCRHKALDLIGDLALIGKPLLGHVIAERAGHAMHFALVSKIMSDPSLYELVTLEQLTLQPEAARLAHALA
ncbi:MAG: UDP-3-O-acyl-N-acetylglucosamine deacetylase [Bryobacteraceae bacterium]|nr:UDP-3-O-acyl-N-acetylglucosamine deacetylase [Bryobacteraceae bacterium]MDW8379320.1 UDP-3-O-acyl-N-acetylglucosamine deacetylase [Bryobacterales bacterium]